MLEITKRREEKGWSKLELSRRARLAPADLTKIESGRLLPYPPQLRRLAEALGVPVTEAEVLLKEVHEQALLEHARKFSPRPVPEVDR